MLTTRRTRLVLLLEMATVRVPTVHEVQLYCMAKEEWTISHEDAEYVQQVVKKYMEYSDRKVAKKTICLMYHPDKGSEDPSKFGLAKLALRKYCGEGTEDTLERQAVERIREETRRTTEESERSVHEAHQQLLASELRREEEERQREENYRRLEEANRRRDEEQRQRQEALEEQTAQIRRELQSLSSGSNVTPDVAPSVTPSIAPDVAPDYAPSVVLDVELDVAPDVVPRRPPNTSYMENLWKAMAAIRSNVKYDQTARLRYEANFLFRTCPELKQWWMPWKDEPSNEDEVLLWLFSVFDLFERDDFCKVKHLFDQRPVTVTSGYFKSWVNVHSKLPKRKRNRLLRGVVKRAFR